MPDLNAFLAGGGEMAALIRAADWAATALGPIHSWPQSLRSALSICLRSPSASAMFWGPDHLFLYNDGWSAYLGDRHPWALGRPTADVMADIWPALEPQFRQAFEEGEAINRMDMRLVRNLGGATFDSYWTYSMLPVAGEDGAIVGILGQARDTTARVMRRREEALMLRLGEALRRVDDPEELLKTAVDLVAGEIDAGRIGWSETDQEAGTVSILACRAKDGMTDSSGTYPLPDFGATINDDLAAGRTIRIDDAATDKRLAEPAVQRLYEASGVVSALIAPIVSGASCRAMLFAHHHRSRIWTEHEEALLRAATDQIWREVSRARAEAALRESERRYRRIFEQAYDLIITADLDQIITDVNPAAAAAMELPRGEIVGRSIRDFVSETGFEQTSRMLQAKVDKGGTTRHDLEVIARSGRLMQWEVNSRLTVDSTGRPVGLHAIARDVTERRRAEERQQLLVNELNHRVKNTLALVQGLALQSFKDGRDPAEARTAFQQRLAALAAAHDLLTRESWEGATLARLIEEAIGHHNSSEMRIAAAGPPVTLGPKAAVSLVIALHELATNAAKYGALSTRSGTVSIDWTVDSAGRLILEWRERGGPPVAPPQRRGFGSRMIERALAADLGGGVRIDFDPAGLVCRIEASLAEAAPRPQA